VFGNKSLISSHSKTIRSPAPSSLPAKNSNCLLLIITIPDRTWIACRNKHMAPAIIAAGPPSRFPHWDCGMSRCDLRAALGWPPQPTRYLLDHALCVQPRRRRSAFVDRGNTRWDFLGVYPHRLQSILCYAEWSWESGGLLPLRNQRGTWDGSRAVAVRRRDGWAMRGVCLCARRPRVRSTTWLDAFVVNCCRLQHRCAAISRAHATAVAAAWKNDGFKFLYFAPKTVGCAAKWWSSHRVLE
jgi:hypothetical protein